MRHNPPNADSPVAQISRITPSALHEQYSTWCEQACEVALPVDSFRPLFYQIKEELQLAMRTSKQGSAKCYICSLIAAVRSGAVGFTEKQFVNTLLIDHVKFHNTETASMQKMLALGLRPFLLTAPPVKLTHFPRWQADPPKACLSGLKNCKGC